MRCNCAETMLDKISCLSAEIAAEKRFGRERGAENTKLRDEIKNLKKELEELKKTMTCSCGYSYADPDKRIDGHICALTESWIGRYEKTDG